MKKLASIFSALSDPSRIRILNLLLCGDLCVCDIERTLGFTQTKVSRHMKYLRRAGLVRSKKSGRWVIYSIRPPSSPGEEIVLASLKKILESTAAAGADRASLTADIEKGCCVGPRLRGTCLPPAGR